MTQYAKYISSTAVQYPTAAEFPGVINWQEHDTALRSKGYCPLNGVPEEQEGKTLVLDSFEHTHVTTGRVEPRPVEVPDYEEDPETGEQRQTGTHTDWRETTIEIDASYITVTAWHYEDDSPDIDALKAAKLAELDAWDNAELPDLGVNWFTVRHQGQDLTVWIKKADRSALALTIDAAEAAGQDHIRVWAGTCELELPIPGGRQLLYAVETYASACYCVTAQHRQAIEALTDAAAVDAYDFRAGYPEHPVFDFG